MPKVKITNPDTILFPKAKITKQELVDYYQRIARIMLPYVKNRPLTMQRFPDGIDKEGFYQKNASDYFPDWIDLEPIKKQEGGVVNYVVANKSATLVYLANQGCVTPHIFLSTVKKLNYPDTIVFDLDPPGKKFDIVRTTALELKELLEKIGLVPFVKTTGSRGLHIVVPIKPTQDFDVVRAFAREIAQVLISHDPNHLTLEIRKQKRRGRVFIDIMRNAFGQTAVAPYGVRAREDAPVATPLEWAEVKDSKLRSDKYTIKTIFRRLARMGDPWKSMRRNARSIEKAHKKLGKLFCANP